jgi:hypothetical protein
MYIEHVHFISFLFFPPNHCERYAEPRRRYSDSTQSSPAEVSAPATQHRGPHACIRKHFRNTDLLLTTYAIENTLALGSHYGAVNVGNNVRLRHVVINNRYILEEARRSTSPYLPLPDFLIVRGRLH